mgnify:CR=1 FL=1
MRKLKTKKQKEYDQKQVHKAAIKCSEQANEFATELWEYEFAVQHIAIGQYKALISAAENYEYELARAAEQYTYTSWDKDDTHNATTIDRYNKLTGE